MKIITNSPEETMDIGFKIGKTLARGDIINLNGDLGAGKTHLVKGIARGLNIYDDITSPTFTIVNEYMGDIPLYHFDVYRIDDLFELYEIGFEEYIYGNGVSIIEWGNSIKDILPKDVIDIEMKVVGEERREIEIINFNRELI
ncbi:tRNA threonylcarbamoyladenosine biosynthesis protein TsaE [Caloramator mitchellensis]|uniref:tRNA threonylcarbamoyladenosine biosynthesis protein TsaE n=1 Tax=Caloramator mitchellensis TaxID=908809 RepID=A0A0R3JVX7_CALMK|nr:tRNA (adenosine(37)-N6)-threonylcarbamoyltransferase complex ATPase subunit type 1 TsaE [Caloramator mitchellensis]KRQ87703.1 tRNA threonylcarbamoyladenosine biosynthesis protein TsaE [Caloramator mitchellensis]